MKILGIDPGSIRCGYGVIEIQPKGAAYVTSGTIAPSSAKPLHERLKYIYEGLIAIIRNYQPDHVVVEKMFFAKSVRAAMSLGYARGIALLSAASEKIDLHECSALEVKKAGNSTMWPNGSPSPAKRTESKRITFPFQSKP